MWKTQNQKRRNNKIFNLFFYVFNQNYFINIIYQIFYLFYIKMGNYNTTITEESKLNEKKATSLFYSNGERYDGEIFERVRHGFGIYYYGNGDRYEGMWFKNLKQGNLKTLIFFNQQLGNGSYFYQNGEIYEGWWNNNLKEGVGTHYYNNGEKYYGEWKNNKKNGKGIIHFEDGGKFAGQFKNNKKHGIGEYIKNKEIFYQEWKDGKFVKDIEKLKENIKNIDYNQLRSNDFEKYLDLKTKQHVEQKSNQIRSKYFPLEVAKSLKSKNPEGFYDSMINLQKSNINKIEKQEIENWTTVDVKNWLTNLGLVGNSQLVEQIPLTGKRLLEMEFERLIEVLNVTDQNIKNLIFHSLSFKQQRSKINFNTDYKSIKSYKKDLKSMDFEKEAKENKEIKDKNNENLIEEKEEEKEINSDDGKDLKRDKEAKKEDESSNSQEDNSRRSEPDGNFDKETQLKNQQENFLQCIFSHF